MRRMVLATLIALTATAPAQAAPRVAVVAAEYFDYFPGGSRFAPELQLHVAQGSSLMFVNADPIGGPHSVVEIHDPGDAPAFASERIDAPGMTEVAGVETLVPGTYPFTCDIHPDLMSGTLIVDPA